MLANKYRRNDELRPWKDPGLIGILGWINLCCGGTIVCILGCLPASLASTQLDATNTPPVVITKIISRRCQMFPGEQNHISWVRMNYLDTLQWMLKLVMKVWWGTGFLHSLSIQIIHYKEKNRNFVVEKLDGYYLNKWSKPFVTLLLCLYRLKPLMS